MKCKVLWLSMLLVLLAGCAPSETAGQNTPYPSPDSATSSSGQEEAVSEMTITPSFTTGKGDTVEGNFSVHLPQAWSDAVTYEMHEMDTTYGISFYETKSMKAGAGGLLFTLTSFPEDTDYSFYPSYELVGTLSSEDGLTENIVASYPSDVQFSDDAYASYNALYEQIPDILAGITAKEGLNFKRPPVAGDVDYPWYKNSPFYCPETKANMIVQYTDTQQGEKLFFNVNTELRAIFDLNEVEVFGPGELNEYLDGYSYRYIFLSKDPKYADQFISFIYNTADNTVLVLDTFDIPNNASGVYV